MLSVYRSIFFSNLSSACIPPLHPPLHPPFFVFIDFFGRPKIQQAIILDQDIPRQESAAGSLGGGTSVVGTPSKKEEKQQRKAACCSGQISLASQRDRPMFPKTSAFLHRIHILLQSSKYVLFLVEIWPQISVSWQHPYLQGGRQEGVEEAGETRKQSGRQQASRHKDAEASEENHPHIIFCLNQFPYYLRKKKPWRR